MTIAFNHALFLDVLAQVFRWYAISLSSFPLKKYWNNFSVTCDLSLLLRLQVDSQLWWLVPIVAGVWKKPLWSHEDATRDKSFLQ